MPPKPKDTSGMKKPPTRTRTKSSKAKEAEHASTSPEPEPRKKTKKATKKAAKKKAVAEDSSGEESDGGAEAEDGPKVDWKDEDLNFLLVGAIEEDEEIKQGLFPLPGANKSLAKGGSKPKTEYQWELARKIFEEHEKYKNVFALAKTPSEKGVWGRKIKNRLKRMTQDVRKFRDEMGETGAGITREEEINMELDNAFTNKWAVIKMECPWYWQLKAIISERPNQVPAGIGNNTSNYHVSLLLASARNLSELGDTSSDGIKGFDDKQHVDDGDGDDTGSKEVGNESHETDDGLGDEGSEEEVQAVNKGGTKRKAAVLEEAKPVITAKKTAPQKGKSTPASTHSASKKSKTGAERMNAVSVKEEETTQKLLELKKTKVRAETEKQVAKVRAKADVEMQADKLKADIAVKKMELEYKLKMAQLGHIDRDCVGHTSFSRNAAATSSSGGWSQAGEGSTTPSSYFGGELQAHDLSLPTVDPYNFNFSDYDDLNTTNN